MDDKSKDDVKAVAAKSIDPAALEMLAHADECGIETAFSRADHMKPCPIGESGACCRICSHGPLPPRRQGRRREDRHLRRRHGHHRRPPLRPAGGGRRRRALRPRPRHGDDAARRRHRRGRRLQGQGRAEARTSWPATWASPRAAARSTRSPWTWPTSRWRSSASRTARSSTRSAPRRSARKLWRELGLTPRAIDREVVEMHAPHPRGRRPGRREHPQVGAPLLPGRRLGRLDAGHRHQRHPLRHAVAASPARSTSACSRTTRSTSSSTATSRRSRR